MKLLPRYPIFIPSKGRAERCLTAKFFREDGVPFHLIVEPQEADQYAEQFGRENLVILPWSNRGLVTALNWLWDSEMLKGHERYWYFDDNIRGIYRFHKGMRIRCESSAALRIAEDFTDRYENIAITGFNYYMFTPDGKKRPPFILNHHVYSSMLMKTDMPFRWRGPYNADTDMCLQVLAEGWCTVQIIAFLIWKETTMTMKGGNTDSIYKGDGRLKMARALERLWPGVVETKRRFKRPQHVIKYAWGRFDTQLKLKPGIDLSTIPPNDYGLKLQAVSEIKSPHLKEFLAKENNGDKK